MNRERALRRDLAALMRAEVPPLTGRQLLSLKSSISGLADDLRITKRSCGIIAADRPPSGRPPSRALDRRADGHRRRAHAGDHRAKRRPAGRHGELHGIEADPGGCRCVGARPVAGVGGKVLSPALLGDDPQPSPLGNASPLDCRLSAGLRDRTDLAGLFDLRRRVASGAAAGGRGSGAAVPAASRPIIHLRTPPALPFASRPCSRRSAAGVRPKRVVAHERRRLLPSLRAARVDRCARAAALLAAVSERATSRQSGSVAAYVRWPPRGSTISAGNCRPKRWY